MNESDKSSKEILRVQNVEKSFFSPRKIDILNGIDFSVNLCETVAIVGPSGSGKSTLLHIMGTLESPTSGAVLFFGKPILKRDIASIRSEKMGFVFQSGNLLEDESLLDNLLIKAKIARRQIHKKSNGYQEAVSLLEKVNLLHRKDFAVKHLSGGEKQRASIARALMNNPSLILADEPTGNLDEASAKNIQDLLIGCCKQLKKSLIVVTHDKAFADQCDRTLSLTEGHIIDQHSSHR